MSSNTPRLGLKRPDGTDAFLRSDFVDNYNKLDAIPGYVPCLSTSRPAWGAAQAGMLISETDTGKIVRWTGSSWAVLNNVGYAFAFGVNPNSGQVDSTAVAYGVGTFYVPRACNVAVIMSFRAILIANARQYGTADVWIDGSSAGLGGGVTFHFPNAGDAVGNHTNFPTVVGWRPVNAGNHSIQGWIQLGTFAPDVNITNIRAMVVLSEA